jgi:peptidyl-prolyl cis-trans isomerase C
MVPPFSEAVIALEKNKYTPEAVKTQFGWHVILREDSRAQTPPPFESVKEQFRSMLQRKKMQDYMENLRKQAKVEIFKPEIAAPAADAVSKLSETAKSASKEAGNAVVDATGNAKQAVTETATKAKEAGNAMTEAAENAKQAATDKLSEAAQSASEKAKQAFTEAAEKAKAAAAEKAAQSVDKISETIKTP